MWELTFFILVIVSKSSTRTSSAVSRNSSDAALPTDSLSSSDD